MHLGSIKTAGTFATENFKYILMNNSCHDSVGGQNTYASEINFEKLAKSIGFKNFYSIYKHEQLEKKIKCFLSQKTPGFMEVRINNRKIKELPRTIDLIKIKRQFMK